MTETKKKQAVCIKKVGHFRKFGIYRCEVTAKFGDVDAVYAVYPTEYIVEYLFAIDFDKHFNIIDVTDLKGESTTQGRGASSGG